jgi:hypothetical protein
MDMAEASMLLQQFKTSVVDATGLSKDALHIYFGLALFIGVRLVWRGRWGWLAAWCAALAMTLTGEWLDLRGEALAGALQPDSAHWHDVWNTMFWPSVLALIGRWLHPMAEAKAADAEASADERAEGNSE